MPAILYLFRCCKLPCPGWFIYYKNELELEVFTSWMYYSVYSLNVINPNTICFMNWIYSYLHFLTHFNLCSEFSFPCGIFQIFEAGLRELHEETGIKVDSAMCVNEQVNMLALWEVGVVFCSFLVLVMKL